MEATISLRFVILSGAPFNYSFYGNAHPQDL